MISVNAQRSLFGWGAFIFGICFLVYVTTLMERGGTSEEATYTVMFAVATAVCVFNLHRLSPKKENPVGESIEDIPGTIKTKAAAREMEAAIRCEKENDVHGAVRHYRRVLELEPDIAGALHNLGQRLSDLKQDAEALAVFVRARPIIERQLSSPNLPPSNRSGAELLHRSLASESGRLDARLGLHSGEKTAFERIYGAAPLSSDYLAELRQSGELEMGSWYRNPLSLSWVNAFTSESRRIYDPSKGDNAAWEKAGGDGQPPAGFSSWRHFGDDWYGRGEMKNAIRGYLVALNVHAQRLAAKSESDDWDFPEASEIRIAALTIFSRPSTKEEQKDVADRLRDLLAQHQIAV